MKFHNTFSLASKPNRAVFKAKNHFKVQLSLQFNRFPDRPVSDKYMDSFGDIFGSSDRDSDEFEGFEADKVEAARARLNGVSDEGFFPHDFEDDLEEMEDETLQWSQNASPVEEPAFIPFGGPKNRPESDLELCFFPCYSRTMC